MPVPKAKSGSKIKLLILKIIFLLLIMFLAFWLWNNTNYIHDFAEKNLEYKLLVVLMGGLFYTSFLTAPLAIVILVMMATVLDPIIVAGVAGLGAVTGDLLIVRFFRKIFNNFSGILSKSFFNFLHRKLQAMHLDFLSVVIGGFIIASPFPDEVGLLMLGSTKLSYFKLGIITYIFNTLGILFLLSPTFLLKVF